MRNPYISILKLFVLVALLALSASKTHKRPPLPKHLRNVSHPTIQQDNNQISDSIELNSVSTANTSLIPVPMTSYISLLQACSYYGQWMLAGNSSSQLQSFHNNNGVLMIQPLVSQNGSNVTTDDETLGKLDQQASSTNQSNTSNSANSLQFLIKVYDGEFLDQQSMHISYTVNSTGNMVYYPVNATIYDSLEMSSVSINTPGGDNLDLKTCLINVSIAFLNQNTMSAYQGPFDEEDSLAIQLQIYSGDCGFGIESSLLTEHGLDTTDQLMVYVAVSCTVSILQTIGVIMLRRSFKKRYHVFNISPTSLFMTIAIDYYILVLNVILIFAYSPLFTIALACNIILTFYFERDLILRLFQYRANSINPQLSDEDCKSCGCHFIAASILFVMILAFMLMYQTWVLYLSTLVLVPQIVQNAYKDRPYKFSFPHVCLMVFSKILLIGYVKIYPENFFRISPDPLFVVIYAFALLVQITILGIQTRYPRFCFSGSSQGRRNTKTPKEDDICPICMSHLTLSNTEVSPTFKRQKTIETICTHSFHSACLRTWLRTKTECPLCRNNIGDLLEELEYSEENSPELKHQREYNYNLL